MGNMLVELSLNLLITIVAYLLVPTILVITGKKFEVKAINRINTLNCVIVWLVFRIIQIGMGSEPTSGAAVILWGGVGYWLLKKNCLKEEDNEMPPQQEQTTQTSIVRVCLSNEDVIPYSNGGGTLSSDVVLQGNTETQKTNLQTTEQPAKMQNNQPSVSSKKKPIRFCSRCGKPIDSTSKKCTGCNKQYFKGISWRIVLTILSILVLLTSVVGNVLLYLSNTNMKERIKSLEEEKAVLAEESKDRLFSIIDMETEINRLENNVDSLTEEIDFYDEHIVFIEDDGTNLYHNYDCYAFAGNSFWAYNTEAAVGEGYKPCPLCCD